MSDGEVVLTRMRACAAGAATAICVLCERAAGAAARLCNTYLGLVHQLHETLEVILEGSELTRVGKDLQLDTVGEHVEEDEPLAARALVHDTA
jgi:hypothetical protein